MDKYVIFETENADVMDLAASLARVMVEGFSDDALTTVDLVKQVTEFNEADSKQTKESVYMAKLEVWVMAAVAPEYPEDFGETDVAPCATFALAIKSVTPYIEAERAEFEYLRENDTLALYCYPFDGTGSFEISAVDQDEFMVSVSDDEGNEYIYQFEVARRRTDEEAAVYIEGERKRLCTG